MRIYENPQVTSENRLAPRSYYIPGGISEKSSGLITCPAGFWPAYCLSACFWRTNRLPHPAVLPKKRTETSLRPFEVISLIVIHIVHGFRADV